MLNKNPQNLLNLFNKDLNRNWVSFLHENDMREVKLANRNIIQLKIFPSEMKNIKTISDALCKDSNLKPQYTFSGKLAEFAFTKITNALFETFDLKRRLKVNSESYVYGGDGGGDFFIGDKIVDIKYRDESPNHGLLLEDKFLETADDSNILVHVTNSISIKLGDLNQYIPKNQTLFLSLSGWTTIASFKEQTKNASGKKCLDDFEPIQKLMMILLQNQITTEELFR